MFVVRTTYVQPIEEVEAHTPAHREWLGQHVDSGLVVLAGPQVPRTGGLMLFKGGQTLDEVKAVLATDPFVIEGLADLDIVEFNPVKMNPVLTDLI